MADSVQDIEHRTLIIERHFKQRIMVDDLFLSPEQLGTAALLMIDLDNLKGINDRFGHVFLPDLPHQQDHCILREEDEPWRQAVV